MKNRDELAEAIFIHRCGQADPTGQCAPLSIADCYPEADAFIAERERQKGDIEPLCIGDRVVMTTDEYEGCVGNIERFAFYIEVRLDVEHNGETLVYCKTEELKRIPTSPAEKPTSYLQMGCSVEIIKVEPGFVGSNGYIGKVGKIVNYYESTNEWVIDFGTGNNLHLISDCLKRVDTPPATPEVEPETRKYVNRMGDVLSVEYNPKTGDYWLIDWGIKGPRFMSGGFNTRGDAQKDLDFHASVKENGWKLKEPSDENQ